MQGPAHHRCRQCRVGDHRGHIEDWHPAPPCPFGGLMCPCAGECENLDDTGYGEDKA